MSDKENEPNKNVDNETQEIEEVKIKIHNAKDKIKNEETKVELETKGDVGINMNQANDHGAVVRRKQFMVAVYSVFGRPAPQHREGPEPQGYLWQSPPPQSERPPPLNYKMNQRNDFVRLVLMLVLTMLIVTAGFIGIALTNERLNEFFYDASMLLIFVPAMIMLMTVNYAFMCSPCANTFPCNIVMLCLATIGMTLIATKISVFYGTEVVLYAVLATSGIVFVCVCLALTNFDFTRFMLYVVVISAAFGLITMIVILVKMVTGVWMKPVIITILAIGTLIQSVLLVIELQTVIGGGAVELSEEDYALGAYMIYTSIIDIFLRMVQIIGLSGRN